MFSRTALKFTIGTSYLRNLSGLVKRFPIHHTFHSSARFSSSIDKDFPTPTQLTSVDKLFNHDTDILLEQLRKAKSTERILELVSQHLDVMNDNHVITSFSIINDKLRISGDGLEKQNDLCESQTFQLLCSHAMKRARYFEPNDVITIFKTLTQLNVPTNTYVMQAILKMLCSQINDLSLNQLTFLNFLLMKYRPSPLVDSLKLALPLVLQVQIDQQLDSDNLNEAVNCLRMACKAKLKISTIEKIVSSLQKKVPEFTAEQACTVAFSLLSLDAPIDGYMQLLKATFQIISNNIDQPSRLSLLLLSRQCARQSFYFRSFFMCMCKRVVSERWKFEECYDLMKRLYKANFFSSELLDFVVEGVCDNATLLKQDPKFSLITLSECLSIVDHQSPNVRTVLDIISSPSHKLDTILKDYPYLFLKMVSSWSQLGYFPSDCLSKVLNEDILYSSWSLSKKYGRAHEFERYMCDLQWALEVYDQTQKFSIPTEFMQRIIQSLQQRQMKGLKLPLTKFLEHGLGGPQFFMNGVFSRNGHFIDHVLAMRNGNYPVALNPVIGQSQGKVAFVEDISVPDDTKVIAVLVLEENDYCTDPEILKGYISLKMKNLLKMNISPIVMNYAKWQELPDREKIPYLMREIKEATVTGEFNKSSLLPS